MSHKCSRIEGSLPSNSVLFEGSGSSEYPSQSRQPDSNCVHEQDGELCTDPSLPACDSDMGLVPSSSDYIASRIRTSQNTTANWESRHHQDSSSWQLCPSVFGTLNHQLGPLLIDLFTSRINHQLLTYCSWIPDPGACSIDVFSISCTRITPYLFLLSVW